MGLTREQKQAKYEAREAKIKPVLEVAIAQHRRQRKQESADVRIHQRPYNKIIAKVIDGDKGGREDSSHFWNVDDATQPLVDKVTKQLKALNEHLTKSLVRYDDIVLPKESSGSVYEDLLERQAYFIAGTIEMVGRYIKDVEEDKTKLDLLRLIKSQLRDHIHLQGRESIGLSRYGEMEPTTGDFDKDGNPNDKVKGLLERAKLQEVVI